MGVALEHPVMNAAGTCKTLEDVKRLTRSAVSAIVVGSITIAQRDGNGAGGVTDYWYESGTSVNSLGLPNPGADYYWANLKEMVRIAHEAGKPLFVSVAGFFPEEYAYLVDLAIECGADGVELNLSCPNIHDGGSQKRPMCFDEALVARILLCVQLRVGTEAKISVKLSPFTDPVALEAIAITLGRSNLVKAVTTTNTFPNALVLSESGEPRIGVGEGLAGMAGASLKPIGLGQVKQLRALLSDRIQIIGVAGINSGTDVLQYLSVGADATQVGTAYLERGEEIFSQLLSEMADLVELEV